MNPSFLCEGSKHGQQLSSPDTTSWGQLGRTSRRRGRPDRDGAATPRHDVRARCRCRGSGGPGCGAEGARLSRESARRLRQAQEGERGRQVEEALPDLVARRGRRGLRARAALDAARLAHVVDMVSTPPRRTTKRRKRRRGRTQSRPACWTSATHSRKTSSNSRSSAARTALAVGTMRARYLTLLPRGAPGGVGLAKGKRLASKERRRPVSA